MQRTLHLSVGESFSSSVSTLETTWPKLVALLSDYSVSDETLEQYNAYPKDQQLRLKDRGWWNGSRYEGTKRAADSIRSLDVLCFDLDTCSPSTLPGLRDHLDPVLGNGQSAYFIGSTRKHTAALPRLRVAIPVSRPVSVDESEAIKRHLAHSLGMSQCDPVTFRANQVMFWPSHCRDGERFVAFDTASDFLDPDAYLAAAYPSGWTDRSLWPLHPNESRTATNARTGKRADPRDRDDLIGVWCRTFDIEDVMDQFIPGVYLPGTQEGRFTHSAGSTANGAAIYENGLYLYSHHQTDRATGLLSNSWDLVRIHKFGELDDDPAAAVIPGITPTEKLPSQAAMRAFAVEVPEIKDQLAEEALGVFDDVPETGAPKPTDTRDLFDRLKKNKEGKVKATWDNLVLMFEGLPALASLAFNANTASIVWRSAPPWRTEYDRAQQLDPTEGIPYRDADDVAIREHIVRMFAGMELYPITTIRQAVELVAHRSGRAFHPIRDHFNSLPAWDGTPRVDSFLSRYTGCPDDAYHRTVGRKFLCSVVKRALEPGCKCDYMLVLLGPQGQKKSWFFETLAGEPSWFADDMPHIDKRPDVVGAIRSKLIVEWAELDHMNRNEVSSIKNFLTIKVDKQRLSYERHTQPFKRQCVMVGTANEDTPLKDRTGGRRFWPVRVKVREIDVEALAIEREQLMAEARAAVAAGERLYLDDSLAAEMAVEAQESAREADVREEAISAWLDGEIPSQRVPLGAGGDFSLIAERRDVVCLRQIALEALGMPDDALGRGDVVKMITGVLARRGDFERRPKAVRIKGYGPVKGWERIVSRAVPKADNVVPIGGANKKPAADYDI